MDITVKTLLEEYSNVLRQLEELKEKLNLNNELNNIELQKAKSLITQLEEIKAKWINVLNELEQYRNEYKNLINELKLHIKDLKFVL